MLELFADLLDFFLSLKAQTQAAIISGSIALVVSIVGSIFGPSLKYWFDNWSTKRRLRLEYDYSEKKKLRNLIGQFHGRLLERAERLNHRFWNLQEHESKGWLDVDGNYKNPTKKYYYTTTVYRFASLLALFKDFLEKVIFIDSRIAEESELLFLKYAKALEWSVNDVALFKGLKYDSFEETDHIFRDSISLMYEEYFKEEKFIGLSEFHDILEDQEKRKRFKPFLNFFDGLNSEEKERYRWDRIISIHLLIMAFINDFGYDVQKTSTAQFEQISKTINNEIVLENLAKWLKKLGLDEDNTAKELREVIIKSS